MRIVRTLSGIALVVIGNVQGCARDDVQSLRPTLRIIGQSPVTFPATPLNGSTVRTIGLQNDSRGDVDLELAVDSPFETERLVHVPGGAGVSLNVTFEPYTLGTFTSELRVVGDGIDQGIPLVGSTREACSQTQCTFAVVDPSTGECSVSAVAEGTECSTTCVTRGACSNGECKGVAVDCDDRDPCTVDFCAASTGCHHAPVTCEASSNPCLAAMCDSSTGCAQLPVADGTSCGPSDCTQSSICVAGACVVRPTPEGSECGDPSPCQSLCGVLAIDATTGAPVWNADLTSLLRSAGEMRPDSSAASIFRSLMSPSDGEVVVSAMRTPQETGSYERWRIALSATTGQLLTIAKSVNQSVIAVASADGFEFVSCLSNANLLECRQPSGAFARNSYGDLAEPLAPWKGKLLAGLRHSPPGGPLLTLIDPLTCGATGPSFPVGPEMIRTSGDAVFVSGNAGPRAPGSPVALMRVDPDQRTIMWSIPWSDSSFVSWHNQLDFVPTSSRSLLYLDPIAADRALVRAVTFDGKPLWDCAPTSPATELLALENDQLILEDQNGGIVSYEVPGLAPALNGWVTEAGDPQHRHRPAVPGVLH